MEFIIIYVLVALLMLVLLAGAYMLVRNNWVYEKRINELKNKTGKYKELPSYSDMLYNYPFTWDVDKIIEKHRKHKNKKE